MRDERIEVLVTKNSGGKATEAKLAAARALGIEVIMVERPEPEEVLAFEKLDDVMAGFEVIDPPHSFGASASRAVLPGRSMKRVSLDPIMHQRAHVGEAGIRRRPKSSARSARHPGRSRGQKRPACSPTCSPRNSSNA